MKAVVILLAISALGSGLAACGSGKGVQASSPGASSDAASSEETSVASSDAAPSPGYLKSDGDGDTDDSGHPGADDQKILTGITYGASSVDRAAIEKLVLDYYSAAGAANGAHGCPLLASSLAAAVAGEQDRSAHDGGAACATSLSRLFRQQQQHLASEQVPTMVVTGVHVHGAFGLATLGFQHAIEAEILLQRESGAWKIDALFDSPLP